MKLFAKIGEEIDKKIIQQKSRPRLKFKDLVDGSVFRREEVLHQLPFIFFIVVLLLFYISNRFAYERDLKQLDKLKKELVHTKYKSLTVSEQLMSVSKQSAISQRLSVLGSELKEPLIPVVVITKD